MTARHLFAYLLLLTTLLVTGCSWESVQHTSYETVESLRQQQCLHQVDSDCSMERTRYDEYQAERGRLQEQKP